MNRAVSAWRIKIGRERAREHGPLLDRLEHTYGVDKFLLLGIWGMESAFGEVMQNPKYMRLVFPALAALAWGEPRRRAYWERELLNALVIVEKGWGKPEAMVGSWAGAMGHTQWMPEVWLNIGVDFDGDGKVSPFSLGDALAGTAQYLLKRGRYRAQVPWGFEVALRGDTGNGDVETFAAWKHRGVERADGLDFPHGDERARLWRPVEEGPAFLLTHTFDAIKSYNPANTYALAVSHLSDRLRGGSPFVHAFPGSERALTLAEVQEMQARLKNAGFDPDATDGRMSKDTLEAVRGFQRKAGLKPVDGYPGLRVLSTLRGEQR